jgi:ABC-2 type transport system permease protein
MEEITMRGLVKLFLIQFKLYLREPVAFFFTLAYPALLLLLFGFIFGNDPDPEFWGRNFGTVDASVPAYAGIIIGTVALMGIPIDTAASRETGVLRRYRATPLHPIVYLTASVAVYLAIALLGMFILILTGKLVFGLRIEGSWFSVMAAFSISALSFFAAATPTRGTAKSERLPPPELRSAVDPGAVVWRCLEQALDANIGVSGYPGDRDCSFNESVPLGIDQIKS